MSYKRYFSFAMSITACFFACGALFGAPQRESLAVQEMRLALDQVGYQLHGHQVEIDLFQERMAKLERSIERFLSQLETGKQDHSIQNRLSKLEKTHESLIFDFKNFKDHANQTKVALSSCEAKLTRIDKQLSSDISGLKRSMQSMLALLQSGEEASTKSYVVKSGDSLGKIALDHKTDIKTLKRLNSLSTDTIYTGQKIIIP